MRFYRSAQKPWEYTQAVHTLASFTKFLLKQQKRIFRWPGFSPSTMEGIDLERSAIEKRISSLFTKSLYLILSAVMSRNVPGCQVSQENTSDFLNGKKCSKCTDTFHSKDTRHHRTTTSKEDSQPKFSECSPHNDATRSYGPRFSSY